MQLLVIKIEFTSNYKGCFCLLDDMANKSSRTFLLICQVFFENFSFFLIFCKKEKSPIHLYETVFLNLMTLSLCPPCFFHLLCVNKRDSCGVRPFPFPFFMLNEKDSRYGCLRVMIMRTFSTSFRVIGLSENIVDRNPVIIGKFYEDFRWNINVTVFVIGIYALGTVENFR